MNRKSLILPLVIALTLVFPLASCNSNSPDDGLSGVLDINGTNTVTPVTTLFAEEFMSLYP